MAKKEKKTKQSLNKKPIIAIVIGGFVLAAIGAVLAFRGDITRFVNSLTPTLDDIQIAATENFTSPDDWRPCQTVPKTVTATNNGNKNVSVRLSYLEWWQASNNEMLPLTVDGTRVAIINLINQNDWELRDDGYYYYKEELAPGATTSSFMQSVTMNCSLNLTDDTLYICNEDNDCETPANEYSNAKYHLRVAVEFLQGGVAWPENPPTGCNHPILYNQIACQTNGPDTNINLKASATGSGVNGFGVNTIASTVNDTFPVHYFRGAVRNNNVVWAGKCWHAIRTTSTGGVKMIYAGEADYIPEGQPTAGQPFCAHSGNDQVAKKQNGERITTKFTDTNRTAGDSSSTAEVGYMYGDSTARFHWSKMLKSESYTSKIFASSLIAWQNGEYVFGDGVYKYWDDFTDTEKKTSRYFCTDGSYPGWETQWFPMEDESWHCRQAFVALGYNTSDPTDANTNRAYGMLLNNGETNVLDIVDETWKNVHDSPIKAQTDAWFASNHLNERISQLEDTVFCNDRSVSGGPLSDGLAHQSTGGYFGFLSRLSTYSTATVNCPNTRDAFTVSSANGNGALRFPVGHVTMDEVALSGFYGFLRSTTANTAYSYLTMWIVTGSYSYGYWTMTPVSYGPVGFNRPIGTGWYMNMIVGYLDNEIGTPGPIVYSAFDSHYIRPVVSLKKGTRYISGDGTEYHPYVIP